MRAQFQKRRQFAKPNSFGRDPFHPLRPWPYNGPLDFHSPRSGSGGAEKQPAEKRPADDFSDKKAEDFAPIEESEEEEEEECPEEEVPDEIPDDPEEYSLDELPERPRILPGFSKFENIWTREFHSWNDFVLCAADSSLAAWKHGQSLKEFGSHCEEHPRYKTDYFGNVDFETAVEMALRSGWPEGRKLLYDSLIAVIPRSSIIPNQMFEVGGAYPNVAIFSTGDPACMVEFQPNLKTTNPVVKIEFSVNKPQDISAVTTTYYGAAVLSIATQLEARGISTELILSSEPRELRSSNPKRIRVAVVYKNAGENLDLDRAAFALLHPTVLRRFMFAIYEQHPDLEQGFYPGYGSTNYQGAKPDFDGIYIPSIKQNCSLEEARRIVETYFQSYLQQKDLAA